MKHWILPIIWVCCMHFTAHSQEKYSTRSGSVQFEASIPSFEEVKAENSKVSAILDMSTGEFAALALMGGFRFKLALMEEHFNENYVESSKYPKATFKGNFDSVKLRKLVDDPLEINLSGTLNLHGQSKSITIPVMLLKSGDEIRINTTFVVNPADFNIKIPKIVRNKISESVKVEVSMILIK